MANPWPDPLPFTTPISTTVTYGRTHYLQTASIHIPQELPKSPDGKLFALYIHGGAWRDPRQTAADLNATKNLFLQNPLLQHDRRIAGFISLDYGLSSHPDFPSDDVGRNYKHPQHVQDVVLALHFLRAWANIGGVDGWPYVLVGHSCGATMALQIALGIDAGEHPISPTAIVGIEGIYDLPALVWKHKHEAVYREFVVGAFGKDDDDNGRIKPSNGEWRRVSPACQDNLVLRKLGQVVIAHSRADQLVEFEQAQKMVEVLRNAFTYNHVGKARLVEIDWVPSQGIQDPTGHDIVWQDGKGVVQAILAALDSISLA